MDIYSIPGDDQKGWRSQKFIQYVMGSTTGADTWLLRTLARRYKLSLDEKIWLCWLHTCCNCEISAWYMFKYLDYRSVNKRSVQEFWEANRSKLVFVTDRIYVKSNNEFVGLVGKFIQFTKRHPASILNSFGSFPEMYDGLCDWRYMGRYSTELFLESIITVSGVDLNPDSQDFDLNQARTMTSGLLNTIGLDDKAISFDAGERLDPDLYDYVEHRLYRLYRQLKRVSGLDITLSQMTPKLCSWRKLFKGQRYGTYYIDRQLHCLTTMEINYPEETQLWAQIRQARAELFDPSTLGENFGRIGIQPGLSKLWLEKGITGFEGVKKPLWNTR